MPPRSSRGSARKASTAASGSAAKRKRGLFTDDDAPISAASKPAAKPKKSGPGAKKKKGSTPMRKTLEALSPSPSKSKGMWASMCEHLSQYRAQHDGSCNVPYKYEAVPKLGRWVHHQRYMFRKFKKDPTSSTLSEERVEELRALGAIASWEEIKTESRTWDESLGRLRTYGEKHGDFNVPTNFAEDQQLGRWVMTQKQQLKKFRASADDSQLSAERVQKLEGLGAAAAWTEASEKRRKGTPRTWEASCKLLQDFMDKHDGSSCVPTKFVEDLQLGNWVVTQKQQLKKYMNDPTKSQLTEARYKKLEDMGVVSAWMTNPSSKGSPPARCNFNEIIEKLVEYAKNHDGDFNVPYSKSEPDQQLSRWVDNQRRLYKKHKENPEKFSYPPKRLKQLSDLGVLASWDTAQSRAKMTPKGIQGMHHV